MPAWTTLKELQPIIESGYKSLGYDDLGDRGYRFLSSPEQTLGADRFIMSINPAGNTPDYENDGMFTDEGTSAYVDERWMEAPMGSTPLQKQFQALFAYLGWNPIEVTQAPFSPYRHPSWSKIPSRIRRETAKFCIENIWTPYFQSHVPSEIICIGKPPAEAICSAYPHDVVSTTAIETGWNNIACRTATIYRFANDAVLIQIPHLSRFGIMTAECCESQLSKIFEPFLSPD